MTITDRIMHAVAITLIGDGVVAALHPTHDAEFWKKGPAGWRRSMRWFQTHPTETRIFAIAQVALATMWVLHQERGAKDLVG